MNKIFKVIWSKSKQCYVVVSEMAKNKTGKKKIVVASILAALAMQAGVVADVSAADRPTATIEGGTKMYSNLTNGLAIGNESQSNSDQSIAIGYRAVANSQYANPAQPAVAVGAGASATGRGGVSLGLIANSGVRGTAIGSATKATGFGAFAGGTYAQATNGGDVAIGGATSDRFDDYATASGGYSVAIGTAAKADGGAGVSIGYKTNAKTSNSLAVGSESQATGEGAVAVGRKNTSTGASSTVLGILSTANATSATAVGMETTAKGENSLAVGHKSSASGKNGVAVGTNFTTSEQGGVAVGNAAKSKETNATAVGIDVSANAANSVALGGSATANSDGAIAIGSHGSRQTTATGNRALAIGTAATANGLDNIAIGTSASTSSQYSTAVGNGATATAIRAAAFGANSTASVEGGVALGVGSVANRAGGIANKGYNPNDNRTNKYVGLNTWVLSPTTGAVAVGNGTAATRQITGLAAGKEDTDAVNVAQLKSVNLAFAGNVGSGDVNLANSTLSLKGDGTYITTAANGQNLTISGKTQNINVTNGQASANAAGMADAKNVADAINKAVSANAYNWKLAADNDNGRSEVINKEDTVSFRGDNNITVARNGKKITTSLNKAITVDTVKANKSVTVSSGGNQITLDGSNGAVTGKTFTGQSFTAGNNVLSNTTLQIGPTTGNNVTITKDGLSGKAGSNTVKFGTNGISAGGQQITNVSSGGNVGTNAANITDVKNAVSDVTLKLDTNSKTGSVKLSESPLKVIGANGIRTNLVGTNNGSLVVGLDNNTVNATTKGIGLTGDTGSTGLKYLKDGDATFKVAGDGDLVTTKASATGVQVAVDSGKVKDLAVGAVTVSKANTTDNPITVTPTAGTNTKDYAIGIDTTKLANQTQLTYKANGANENKVSLANGLNFTNGTFTTATVGTNGNVTISTATETITNDADGKAKVASPTDGLATAKNVAESINKAVDGLSQNLTVSDGTTDGTVNLKNQKLTVSGTNGVTATVNGQTVTVGLDTATKSKVDNASTAVNRNISLGADSGTPSSQSLKDGDVAFNVKGASGDFVSTKMNGDTVEVSTKRSTINSDAAGTASVAGDDGLATAKNVADAINKAASQAKDGAAWKLSANGDTPTTVAGGDTVDFTGDNNITVTQTGKNIATTLNKDLKKLNSISLENGVGETIKFDAINASGKFGDPAVGNYTQIDRDGIRINNGIDVNQPNTANTYLDVGTLSLQAGPNSSSLDSKNLMFNDEDGNFAQGSAQGMAFQSAAGKMVQFSLDEINAGGNKIQEVAEGTADTDAVNVKQLKDTVASQTLTYRANTAADTDAKTVKLSKGLDFVDGTMTKATIDNDGKVTFDINDDTKAKINDSVAAVNRKVSLGADSGTVSSQSLKDGDVAFNVKGATGDFISTKMNGDTVEVSTKRATIDSNATTGAASVTGDDGLATAKNVADAINKAAKASSDAVNLKFSGDTNTSAGVVNLKDDTFGIKGDGKYVTTDADGKNLTVKVSEEEVKKSAVGAVTVSTDTTDANNPLTVTGTTSADGTTKDYKVTIDGTKVAAKTNLSYKANDGTAKQVSLADGLNFKNGNMTTASIDDAGVVKYDVNTEMITAGADGTITGPATDGVATAKNVADAINAAKKATKTEITANDGEAADATTGNVTLTSSAAADGHTIYDVKLNDKVTLGTGANAVTLDGTTGAITGKTATIGGVTVDGTNKYVTGLGNTTWNGTATTGRAATEDQLKTVADAAKASTDAVNLKFSGDTNTSAGVVNLKDDTFGIKGDGKYVTTDADGKNLTVKVSEEEVKKSAVGAVTVSTDTTDANNPLTVTGTTSADGTTKDYKVTIDGTKVAAKTNLSYKANDGTAKQVSLADGLNFKNGNMTTASIDDAGVVKYDVNTETITAGADGTITGPATDGVATAKNVADAINAAKKSSKTEITANDGEAADGTTGNVVLTSSKAADGHTIYDVKLNDKVTLGTGANAVTLDGTTGAITGKTATIGGVTVDGTNKYVTGLGNTTWNGTATTGRAATEDQLKTVADAAKASTDAVNLKFSGDTNTSAGVVNLKDDTFGIKGDGKYVTTDADGKNLTVKVSEEEVKKSAVGAVTVSTDTTDANNPLTVTGTTSADGTTKDYKVTIDGTKVAAKTNLSYKANDGTAKQVSLADGLNFKNGNMTTASIDDAGVVKYDVNTEMITAGADGTITGPATDGVATAKNVADAINAAKKATKTEITANDGEAADATTGNVTLTSTTAADGHTIYDVKLNDKVTLGTGANAVTIDGTTGAITGKTANIGGVTVDGTNKYVTGLGNTTWNGTATTGRAATEDQLKTVADAAKASTDAVNLKFSGDTNTSAGVVNLKDDTFGIKGDGKYVTTDADGKNLTVKVSEEEVKKSAVGAVTVSTDTTDANNPLTVTGTTSADGTTKDYKVTIDGAKVATKTKLSYKANDGTAKQVSLADGLNFKDGTLTTATIDDAGVVKYDVKTAAITAGTDGTVTGPATDGVATAKNVADAINAAKKASKTEITANDDEAANATTGNVKLTSTTAADGHTIYNVKLNDTLTFGTGANAIVIDGTAGKATIGSAAIDGVNNTITTGGNKAVTLDGTTGTITGKAANIGGVTVDGTNNHVTGLANTTWDGNAVSGRAATEDQLKVVADAAANQTWQITADKDAATSGKQTGTKTDAKVGKDAKVTMIAGENITINQNERDFTYSLNKDLVNMNSASFNGTGNNTTVINGDSITQTAGTQTNTSTAAGNTVADGTKSTATTADGTKITDGTKTNTSTADSTVIDDGNGNNTALTKDGVTITAAGKDPVSLTKDGLNNGGNKISNIADGTDDTDAVNVRQLEAKSKASKTELTANGGESAGSTTGNIVLTKTTAADGHIIYDNKLNDKVTLGTDPTKAVTVDGTNGTIKAGKDGNAVAINGTDGTIKAGDGTNAVAIDGKNGSVKAGDKIALDGKDGKATIGTVGIDGKDGVISGLANKTWDPNNITPGRAATEDQVKSAVADAGWDAAVGTEGSGVNSTPSATAEKVKPNETLTFKAGNNMMVSQNGKSISYAVNPELTDMKSATFKDADGNTTVTNGNGMTITPGSANPNKPNAGPVSLTKDGLNNGNNQLKGIAPGTDDTDAVNVGQLKASNAKIGDAIGQVAGEVQRVGAHAAAMAALKPIQYDPLEPTQVMAGVGNYRGETAAALGLAHYTNEDTMFNVGVSLGANRNMVNAGVTHKFGSSPEKKNIPDRYKAGPISSVYVMQDEVSSLKKENSEQKTVIADQAARLNTLEAENERQRQELAETKQGLEDLRAAVNQLLASKG